ncbi:MAG: DUF819 family protein [Bacteroidales bacterium]|nr:DUF819 family protein [Candidatus Cacconaster merdequi]
MLATVIYILLFLLCPALVLWLCNRVKVLSTIGPILILYVIGIALGNLWKPEGLPQVQDLLSSAMVPLAIPLMLFGCTFRKGETRSQVLALVTGLVSVCIAVIAGYLLFGRSISGGPQIGGMLTGVYTGGTINLAALKTMLDVPDEEYILLNSYDMIISFLYLAFLLAVGIKLFRRFLPNGAFSVGQDDMSEIKEELDKAKANPYKGLFTKAGLKDAGYLLGATLIIVGVSAGLGLLAGDKWFMVVLILTLTTLGIGASFVPAIRTKKYGYDIGMYFIYIFCMVVASMADLSKLDLAGGVNMLAYLALVIFGSLFLQVVFAKIFRIDSDTMVVSSVAYICSPPFVPMIAAAMKNRRVLVAGLSIGIFGYAIGNYLGFLICELLKML